MRRALIPLSIAVAVFYAALAFGAAGCQALQSDLPHPTHHHKSHVAHSAVCAWACQANSAVLLTSIAPSTPVTTFASLLLVLITSRHTKFYSAVFLLRGPPAIR